MIDPPSDLLEDHPSTAYFWGHVAGGGDVRQDRIVVECGDEVCANHLAAIAGGGTVDHRRTERPYAHNASITRTEDEYQVTVTGDVVGRAVGAFGLPTGDDRGGYQFDAFADADRQLLRGLLESCGTVCFKSSAGSVGISFVHDDRRLLETVGKRLTACPVEVPIDEIREQSSSGHWFGVADEAAEPLGEWVYEGSTETELFAPTRRRKLRQSLEQAANA